MKKVDDIFWEMFTKSGEAGYYMLYNALQNDDENRKDEK